MDTLYKEYRKLGDSGSWLGLEPGTGEGWFCTPVGAEILGWDNGIHYCRIPGFGEMVFCVNPEPLGEQFVYPIARNFRDFLGMILAAGNTNPLQQVIGWDRDQYDRFLASREEQENRARPEVQQALESLRGLGIAPIGDPFGYIRELQQDFPWETIPFPDDYYDALGLER